MLPLVAFLFAYNAPTKCVCGRSFARDHTKEAYSASPATWLDLRGLLCGKGRGRKKGLLPANRGIEGLGASIVYTLLRPFLIVT